MQLFLAKSHLEAYETEIRKMFDKNVGNHLLQMMDQQHYLVIRRQINEESKKITSKPQSKEELLRLNGESFSLAT